MALKYLPNGRLVVGTHLISWAEFVEEFGYTSHRKQLIEGLKMALNILKKYGCERVYIDGSFVTKKLVPGDWDGCYVCIGMNESKMRKEEPVFHNMAPPRQKQKDRFKGEMMPSDLIVGPNDQTILDYFKFDNRENIEKGIIELSLRNFIL